MTALTAVIMAKLPEPGRVKTRLIEPGGLDAEGAAALAWAMLECTLRRLRTGGWNLVLAAAPDGSGPAMLDRFGGAPARIVDQGPGDLGARLDRVWRRVGTDAPIAFFGVDAPDVPARHRAEIERCLGETDVAAGPTADGGYWVLAARAYAPALLLGIDWGGDSVYDQTRLRAEEAGLTFHALPPWHDVDRPEDVVALRRRLAGMSRSDPIIEDPDGVLRRLERRIDGLLGGVREATADD